MDRNAKTDRQTNRQTTVTLAAQAPKVDECTLILDLRFIGYEATSLGQTIPLVIHVEGAWVRAKRFYVMYVCDSNTWTKSCALQACDCLGLCDKTEGFALQCLIVVSS